MAAQADYHPSKTKTLGLERIGLLLETALLVD